MAQRGKRDAQAGTPCAGGALGPEVLDENFTGMRLLSVVSKCREQRPRFLRAEARNHPVPLHGAQPTEEFDSPQRVHVALFYRKV